MLGTGVLSNYPEGSMWYEMSQKKDLVFLRIPEDLRQEARTRRHHGELVTLPFRYLRGLDDEPYPTVGLSGLFVYGRDDLRISSSANRARARRETSLIKWTIQPFSYDPNTVGDGDDVPLHPAAARYYREQHCARCGRSGTVARAPVSTAGAKMHPAYDKSLGGSGPDVTEQRLKDAPEFSDDSWQDRNWETRNHR